MPELFKQIEQNGVELGMLRERRATLDAFLSHDWEGFADWLHERCKP